MAFWRRKPEPGLLHHSDRGSQSASKEYRTHLSVMKMQQSMSRKGDCWDNAPRGCKKFCVNRHFAGNCNFKKWNKNDYTIIIT